MSRFGGGNRAEKKENIIAKVKKFFEKYFGLGTAAEDANEYEYTNKENNEELRIVAEDKKDYKKD